MFSPLSKLQRRVKGKKDRKKWSLFHATDFQSLMYPCFTFCRILRILPYKINASSFEISKLDYILSSVVTCFFSYCALKIICEMNISGWFHDVREAIEINLFYMFGSFITIVTFVSSGPRIRLLQTILRISSILPSESYSKLSVLIHAKDIFGLFYLLAQSCLWYHNGPSSIVLVTSLYIALLEFQMDMMYINCVCVLKTCFKKINDDLANLLITHEEPHSVTQIYHKQRNLLLLMKINALKKQHLIASNAVQRLKIIFSPQLLATIAETFTEFTFEIFLNVIEWHNGWTIVLKEQLYHTYVIYYIVYYLAKITLVAWACETGKNQAVKISTTIHDVLNSTNDEQIKYELQLFALQIMHCDNTFSAKGLTLDATLVSTMAGAVATYILILIQFLITTHSCDEKTAINITHAIS